jgi:uncharacterized membrane protein
MTENEDSTVDQPGADERANHSIWSGLTSGFRSRIVAGLVLVVPIWTTVVVFRFLFHLLRDTSLWLIEALLLTPLGEPLLARWGWDRGRLASEGLAALPLTVHACISLLSVVLTVVLVYVLGAVATNVAGKRMIRLAEKVVDRLPLVKLVYYASKKVLETFAGGETRPFQQVVLVPFPTRDMQSVGFVTHVDPRGPAGESVYTVFVAMAPHLTSGFVFVTPAREVIELDWTVEQALKVIISGGMLMPGALPLRGSSASGGGES